jgi:hypothetical protein
MSTVWDENVKEAGRGMHPTCQDFLFLFAVYTCFIKVF